MSLEMDTTYLSLLECLSFKVEKEIHSLGIIFSFASQMVLNQDILKLGI